MKKTDGINIEEDAGGKHVEAEDDLHDGAATNYVLTEARQQEGVESNDETEAVEEGEESEVA
jgi:hypothetical protein